MEELDDDAHSIDFFRSSPVTIFHRADSLSHIVKYLEYQGYSVAQVDCTACQTESDFFNAILFALNMLSAEYKDIKPVQFWDLLGFKEFSDVKGAVLVLWHLDDVYVRMPESVMLSLKELARLQYRRLWWGDRFTTMVYVEDPLFQLPSFEYEARTFTSHWV